MMFQLSRFNYALIFFFMTGGASLAAPTVSVSVEPLALIVREICSDQCEVFTLVPRGSSEHSWQPGPKDVIRAKESVASVGVGLGFDDSWFKKLNVAPKSILQLGEQLSPMTWWSDDMLDPDEKSSHKKNKSSGQHSHEHEEHDHHDHTMAKDPHIWTDAGRMALAAELVAKHLSMFIPSGASALNQRGKLAAARLTKLQLDTEIRRKAWRTRPVVMFHDTAGYFARRFNLPVLSVASGATGHELSAKMIARVARKFKSASVAAVMVEKSDGAAKNLAKELKTKVAVVDFAASQPYKLWDDWYLHLVSSWESVLQ
jgi:zinc transport system substrate-binding protein